MTVTTNNFIEQNVLITDLYNLTSGQRSLMKGHITPTLVTPAEGEFILKPRFRHDTLSPADLSLADNSAAPCCCLHSPSHFSGGTTPKVAECLQWSLLS